MQSATHFYFVLCIYRQHTHVQIEPPLITVDQKVGGNGQVSQCCQQMNDLNMSDFQVPLSVQMDS